MSIWDEEPLPPTASPRADEPSAHPVVARGATAPRAPELIEQYRTKREALAAETEKLERLRKEVTSAAQRDAVEIVTRAKREIRQVVTDARRELLELSAQVQAANLAVPAAIADPHALNEPELGADLEQVDEWLTAPAEHSATSPLTIDVDMGATPRGRSRRLRIALSLVAVVLGLVAASFLLNRREPARTTSPVQGSTPPPSATSTAPPVSTPPPAPEIPASASPISVVLETQRATWIRATVDGRSDVGRIYGQGETRRFDANQDVVLRAGDAGAVRIALNGGEPQPLGRDGQTLTRRFGLAAAATPAEPAAEPSTANATGDNRTNVVGGLPTIPPSDPFPPASGGVPTSAPAPAGGNAAQMGTAGPSATPVPAAPPPAVSRPAGRPDLATLGQQWLDAYHRQDRAALEGLSAPTPTVTDDRRTDERFPFGLELKRVVDDVKLELSGDTAVFTARMTETAATREYVSRVSQIWMRRAGQWRLQECRLVNDATLNRLTR